jgi:DNA-binding winged helix-turn-helix (wHTH) protein
MGEQNGSVRYRFGPFVLAPALRQLFEGEREVPLIPRYFDLLLLLVERRSEAIDRRLIFDRVWSDVVVSDGALSQAVRTLRRALGDDPREPRYIRTVARHGYRFVFEGVVEEQDRHAPGPALPGVPAGTPGVAEGTSLPLGAPWAPPPARPSPVSSAASAGTVLRWAGDWNVPRRSRSPWAWWARSRG